MPTVCSRAQLLLCRYTWLLFNTMQHILHILGFFFSSGNIFVNYFTIFRALSALVPFPPKVRHASGRKGFLGEFVDNLRQEFSKNQEMKDNIKKFREEAKRLEESDALQQARRKYVRFSYFRVKFLCEPESNLSV